MLGFSFSATVSEARAALDAALADVLGGDEAEAEDTAPYLAHLLGLPLRPGEAIQTEVAGRSPEPLHRRDPPAPARPCRTRSGRRGLRGHPLGRPGIDRRRSLS